MSRIRSIKPDFWSSEQVLELTRDARLLFIGLWNFCDDAGRFRWSARTVKAQVFPGDDDVSAHDVEQWLSRIAHCGLIERYVIDGQAYGYVTGWAHQKINRAQDPKYPEPPKKTGSPTIHPPFTESAVNGQCAFNADPKGSEGIRREGKGFTEPTTPPSFADSVGAPDPEPADWEHVATAWIEAGWQGDRHTARRDFVRIAEHARRQCGNDLWLSETAARLARWVDAKPARIHKPPKWFLEDWPSLAVEAPSGPPNATELQAEWTRLHDREIRLEERQRDLGRMPTDERLRVEPELAQSLTETRIAMRKLREQIEATERRQRA
jgi:hypothetical protein